MASPQNELIGVSRATLRAYQPLVDMITAAKIVYRATAAMQPPYVTCDDSYETRSDITCFRNVKVTMNIHAWTDSGEGALQDARAIAGLVVDALHEASLSLPTNRLVTLENAGTRVFYDADGVSGHAVVSFNAVVETAE